MVKRKKKKLRITIPSRMTRDIRLLAKKAKLSPEAFAIECIGSLIELAEVFGVLAALRQDEKGRGAIVTSFELLEMKPEGRLPH